MILMSHNDLLPLPFLYLKLCGVWKPITSCFWVNVFYDSFTVLMIVITEIVIITEILSIVFANENQSELLKDNIYIIFTMISGWFKMLNFVWRRQKIMLLIDRCISIQWNPPKDNIEFSITTKHNQFSRNTTLICAVMTAGSVSTRLLTPIFTSTWILPVDAWYPCNLSLPSCYWTSYAHQATGYMTIATVHLANECLVSGFMLQICIQLNILKYRILSIHDKITKEFTVLKNENNVQLFETVLMKDCINCHNDILQFAELLSETFIEVVFIQFCAGLFVICTSIYLLAKVDIFSLDFFGMLFYLSCMLIQIFLYCWFGNEVILESINLFHGIYEMDWIPLRSETQKALLIMMLTSSSPIQLFKGAIIKVNLNAFIDIVKLSYSAFNLLQKSSGT